MGEMLLTDPLFKAMQNGEKGKKRGGNRKVKSYHLLSLK